MGKPNKFMTATKTFIKKAIYKNEWLYPMISVFGIKLRKYQYAGLYDYCVKEGSVVDIVKEENTHEARAPFCNKKGLNAFGAYEKGRDYKIYISKVKDVSVFADSEFIYKNNKIYTDRYCYDAYNRYLCPPLKYAHEDRALFVDIGKYEKIERGIFLLKYWGAGWWHLTCEVLPRIILIDRYEEFREYPLLLDEELFKDQRNIDLINAVNTCNHPIIRIKRNVEYCVQDLVYPSHITWLLWDQTQADAGQSWATETSLIRDVRDTVLGTIKLEKKFADKIFITRGNNNRFDNEVQASEYFSKNGFQVINPESLTFKEEVEMCYFAKAIICTLGSAMANILYANKDVKHVMIGLQECQTEANAPVIDAVGIEKYRYYCAETIKKGDYVAFSQGHISKEGMDEIIEYCSED